MAQSFWQSTVNILDRVYKNIDKTGYTGLYKIRYKYKAIFEYIL